MDGSSNTQSLSYHHALARRYVVAGVKVFPCGTNKRPLIKDYEKAATCDLEIIDR
jgi:hypothetical protein